MFSILGDGNPYLTASIISKKYSGNDLTEPLPLSEKESKDYYDNLVAKYGEEAVHKYGWRLI